MYKLKIGIFGAGRGIDLAQNFLLLGCEIVSLCDNREARLREGAAKLPDTVKLFSDFDAFLDSGVEAVVLANCFHEHTPYAIRCLERNIHVFSECISNGTMAEGVQLYDAAKKSKAVYMLAENYPQMIFNREMKRICDGGSLGKIMYAEGEYNHPTDHFDDNFNRVYRYYPEHWRNYTPTTYYITHSLGPIMWATGATPKQVSALSIFAPPPPDVPTGKQVGDTTSILTMLNDDGSVFRVTGCGDFGGHHNAYRICGAKGQIENIRGMGNKIMLRYNAWEKPEDKDEVNMYDPAWNDPDIDMIEKSGGHGGSDYLTCRTFLNCIKEGKQPEHPFDVKSAIVMSSCAILGHRSALESGKPYAIPDFDLEEDRRLYENDHLSPFFGKDGSAPTLPSCATHPDYKCSELQMKLYKQVLGLE